MIPAGMAIEQTQRPGALTPCLAPTAPWGDCQEFCVTA